MNRFRVKEKKIMKFIGTIWLLLLAGLPATVHAQQGPGNMGNSGMMGGSMMQGGMMGGPMMIACMLFALLIIVLLVLAILSLIKYLRGEKR